MVLRDVQVVGDLTSATAEYSAGEQRWVRSFTVRALDDRAFEHALTEADLHFETWIDPQNCWAIARQAV